MDSHHLWCVERPCRNSCYYIVVVRVEWESHNLSSVDIEHAWGEMESRRGADGVGHVASRRLQHGLGQDPRRRPACSLQLFQARTRCHSVRFGMFRPTYSCTSVSQLLFVLSFIPRLLRDDVWGRTRDLLLKRLPTIWSVNFPCKA